MKKNLHARTLSCMMLVSRVHVHVQVWKFEVRLFGRGDLHVHLFYSASRRLLYNRFYIKFYNIEFLSEEESTVERIKARRVTGEW